ncbi:MAG: WD40 repeat domain-containing protein [Planctomycetota bacterium]|nr:WD40 repeat domain-containing protein [Planctomycetota bacterium]MDA0921789.1 WD40 repeat domain-containing protein [Planctomycetota bacterium]
MRRARSAESGAEESGSRQSKPKRKSSSKRPSSLPANRSRIQNDLVDESEFLDDDYDDPYDSQPYGARTGQKRGQRGGPGGATSEETPPIVRHIITGSIIAAVYVATFITLDIAIKPDNDDWQPPSTLGNALGPEVATLQYGIRPPSGLTFIRFEDSGKHRDWTWAGNGQSLTVSVRSNPLIAQHGLTEPEIHTTKESFRSNRPEGDHPYVLDGATVEHGTINGVKFTRARWDMRSGTFFMGPETTHSYRYFTDYITYDGVNRIDVVLSSTQPFSSINVAALEASVFTLRRLPPDSDVAAPPDDTTDVPDSSENASTPEVAVARPNESASSSAAPASPSNRASGGRPSPNTSNAAASGSSGWTRQDPLNPPIIAKAIAKFGSLRVQSGVPVQTRGQGQLAPGASPQPFVKYSTSRDLDFTIAVPRQNHHIDYAMFPSPFMLVNDQIHSLETGDVVGTLPFIPNRKQPGWLSPDARWFVTISPEGTNDHLGELDVISVETGQLSHRLILDATVDNDEPSFEQVLFSGVDKVLARSAIGGGNIVVVWNLKSGQLEQLFHCSVGSGIPASVSQDGRFLVLNSRTSIPVYSTETGDLVATLAAPPTERASLVTCNAFAFSPDTSEVAAYSWISGDRFTCWNNKGAIIFDQAIPNSWFPTPRNDMPINWLPDGSGWLLGQFLIHRETKQAVWRTTQKAGLPSHSRLINQDWVLVHHEPPPQLQQAPFYRAVKIPWDRINSVIEDCRTGSGVTLTPEQPVAIELQFELFGKDTTGPELSVFMKARLKALLESNGLEVLDSAETIVRMKYVETPSDKFGEQSRDRTRTVRYEFEFSHGGITAPALIYDDGSTVVFHENSENQHTLNARRRVFDNCARKILLPSAASTNPAHGSIPVVYHTDE